MWSYSRVKPKQLELSHTCFRVFGTLVQSGETTISFIIFYDFPVVYQIFLSPQVKWWAIITYKHGIYELSNELPSLPAEMKVLLTLAKTLEKKKLNFFALFAISYENYS